MIALAIAPAGSWIDAYSAGVADYVREHPARRWDDVVVIPRPLYRPGALRRYRLEGLIAFLESAALEADARSLGVPVVNLSGRTGEPPLPAVTVDSRAVGALAADYFISRGYVHFAYVAPPEEQAYARDRGLGFIAAAGARARRVAWFGAPPAGRGGVEGISADGLTTAAPGESIAAWLGRLPMPLAVFAAQDALAAEVKLAATAARLRVPQQVSILGVETDPTVHDRAGGISGITLPRRRVGYEAAAMLDGLLDGRRPDSPHVLVPPGQIVTRASSDAHAVDDALVLEALNLIEERCRDPIDVGDIAAALPLSRRALERRFLKSSGATLKQRLQQARVDYAARLLTGTRMPIDEIAHASGFRDRNRFYVAFRAATGEAPSRYRAARAGLGA